MDVPNNTIEDFEGIQMPCSLIAHPGYHVLRNIIETLRATGTYTDEEGEATNHLADFAAALTREQEAQPAPSIETAPWPQVSGYSGGSHPDGLYAHVTLEINGKLVEYVRAAQPAAQEPSKG